MNKKHTIFLFGEAEKGDFCLPLRCPSLSFLAETFGNPPEETLGLLFAIQTLLFERELIYFRVKEEGYSLSDYMKGIRILQEEQRIDELSAIGIPGVGNREIMQNLKEVCNARKSILISSERDLYDYLTA